METGRKSEIENLPGRKRKQESKEVIKNNNHNNKNNSPTEDAQPVVYGDDDHVAVASQDAAVKHVAGSLHVGAAVDEDHHRFGAPTLPDVCGDGDRKQAGGTGESTHTECDSRHRCTFLKN